MCPTVHLSIASLIPDCSNVGTCDTLGLLLNVYILQYIIMWPQENPWLTNLSPKQHQILGYFTGIVLTMAMMTWIFNLDVIYCP